MNSFSSPRSSLLLSFPSMVWGAFLLTACGSQVTYGFGGAGGAGSGSGSTSGLGTGTTSVTVASGQVTAGATTNGATTGVTAGATTNAGTATAGAGGAQCAASNPPGVHADVGVGSTGSGTFWCEFDSSDATHQWQALCDHDSCDCKLDNVTVCTCTTNNTDGCNQGCCPAPWASGLQNP